jgi:hypothetical protein
MTTQQLPQPHSNALKRLAKIAGYTIQALHMETGIPLGTLYRWADGRQVIPRTDREKLAGIIGCKVEDLAPYPLSPGEDNAMLAGIKRPTGKVPPMKDNRAKRVPLGSDGCFSFGKRATTTLVLDGNGTEAYVPEHIHTFYDPQPATFFPEVLQAKEQIQQEELQKNGELWNSEKYHLSRIVVSRESMHEHMTLRLWLKPRDHYTGLATRRCLGDPAFRQKYLAENDWYTPIVGMSMSMGVDMTVVSSDGYALLTQRGQNQSVHQGMFNCSVSEAVSPLLDRSTTSQAPDLYRCASRGFAEELGLHESVDFSVSDILFLSFTVDTQYALYGLRGMVKVQRSAEEILQRWQAGVKDKRENKQMVAVPFTPEAISSFVSAHEAFTPGGLVCLYHALVHEFGRHDVDQVIASFS